MVTHYPYDLKVFGRVSAKAASWDTVFTDTYKHIRDMERIAKQVLNVRGRKGCAAALSREYQRNWSDRAWQVAIAKGNYDLGRQHLNFQISKGGKIAPIDKSKSIPQMMAENLAARGIKDKNEGLTEPRFRTVADFVFSGSQWKMRELAFGDQEVVFKPGDNKENYAVKRMPEIEQWATDIYNFVAGKYGEENIVAFYVHLDETSPHIHCVLLPIKDGKFAFKEIFAGANNREYSQRTSKLHDELAMVNEPWGLVRGTSQTETRQRHRPTEEYRKHLSEECSSKEEELDNLNKAVSDLRVEIALAERRVKGLSSMVEHLKEEKHQKMLEIDKLKVQIANKEGDSSILSQKLEKLQNELASVDEKLADKKDKLAVADLQLDELNKDMEFVKERTETLRQDAMQFSREAQTGAGTLIKTAMLESMVTDYRSKMASLPPEIKVAFDGSPLETIAEHTAEVLHCATLLYLGYIDQATTFAEGQGGGGGGSNDMKWGRNDDEDDRRWAHRCLAMANRMMRPKGSKSRKR